MDLVIFDLDGTLIDSKLDLAHAVNAARAHLGLAPIENERVYSYVGNGAPVLIRRALGPEAPQEMVDRALAYFLDYYRAHMLDYTTLYEGVAEALELLRRGGIPMAVLTNKPVRFSRDIVAGLGLGDYFVAVYGGNSFETKKPDPLGVNVLIRETGARRERTLMVGDSAVDVQTARNAAIPACGVSYGFQPESLLEAPPDVLVDRLDELAAMILDGRLARMLARPESEPRGVAPRLP